VDTRAGIYMRSVLSAFTSVCIVLCGGFTGSYSWWSCSCTLSDAYHVPTGGEAAEAGYGIQGKEGDRQT
jgi:hypothetical protein